jgi:hypothetical protein
MIEYRKTRVMNILGSIGLMLVGITQIFKKVDGLNTWFLVVVLVLFTMLAIIAFGTARALSINASTRLRTIMLRTNWALIIFWSMGLAVGMYFREPLNTSLFGMLIFVVPELINIRALRSFHSSQECQAEDVT